MLFLPSARQFKSVLFIEKMDIEISWTDVEHHWTRFELVESRYSSMLVLAVLITRWGFDLGHLKKSYSKTKLWVWKSPGQTGEKKPFPKRPQIISTKKKWMGVFYCDLLCLICCCLWCRIKGDYRYLHRWMVNQVWFQIKRWKPNQVRLQLCRPFASLQFQPWRRVQCTGS